MSSCVANKNYTFIDLFSGIGGFHLAMHKVGVKCVFAVEIDDACRATYMKNFCDISPKLFKVDEGVLTNFPEDITKVNVKNIPTHNILCAGFPCQPFSQAGYKKGFDDDRGVLFFYIAKIIKEKHPECFFFENVRGLLTHDNGRTFSIIKDTLLDLGYTFHYKVIKASDFNLPQHRPRLYMVGLRSDINDTFEFPKSVPLLKTMSDVFDGAMVNKKVGFTLRVGGKGSSLDDRRNWDGYLVNGVERRITPREAKRMQGFPEDFSFPTSRTQAMKQLGNSVAVPVIEAIANEIVKVLDRSKEMKYASL